MVGSEDTLALKLGTVLPHLDERQRRVLMGAEARALGHGGIRLVARAAGVSEPTVRKGLREVQEQVAPSPRARRPGGGRKPATVTDPGLWPALETLVDPATRGDPMSPLLWTSKSTRTLATELAAQGHVVSYRTVGAVLRAKGYRLMANRKTREGSQHPDRDAQFRYLAVTAQQFLDAGDPVISVDTKKKELVGDFANGGKEYQPAGQPVAVRVHDFKDPVLGKAIPYGVYDVAANAGWVSVGTDHDTSAFAVATIRRWWEMVGRRAYPDSARLLVTADGGGSNSWRTRLWKVELGRLAADTGLQITCCHLPPGTSKWNKIEHRLFNHITMNWRGRPLESHEVIVETIGATTTATGLTVRAELDERVYPAGLKVTAAQVDAVPKRAHDFHGEWNYTILAAEPL